MQRKSAVDVFVFENRRFLFRCGDLGGENENNIAFLF